MVQVLPKLYVAVMVVAVVWMVYRIVKYYQYARAQRNAELMTTHELMQSDFKDYLENLRAQTRKEKEKEKEKENKTPSLEKTNT